MLELNCFAGGLLFRELQGETGNRLFLVRGTHKLCYNEGAPDGGSEKSYRRDGKPSLFFYVLRPL